MLNLDEISPDDVGRVGAKATSLARLRRMGLRVPDALVIDNAWFRSFIEHAGLAAKVELLEKIVWTIRSEHLRKVAGEITTTIRNATLPIEMENAIGESLRKLELADEPLVCRSSSSFEDSAESAFPGVFRSTLGIRDRQQLTDAIIASYGSLFEMKALKYLLSRCPSDAAMQMAVIVQRLVQGEVAGVAFSQNPTDSHDRSIIVEVVSGLCDSLVSGKSVPVRFRIDERDHWAMEPGRKTVPEHFKLLDTNRLTRLANICRQLRLEWGQNVDVEFAFVASDDEPYLFQCRPITVTLDTTAQSLGPRYSADRVLQGITCAHGSAEGNAIDFRQFQGDVSQLDDKILLVDGLTTEEFDAVFACRGIVSQRHDSQLNHVSIACRELGIPYIAAVDNACEELSGRRLALDGATGSVRVLPDEPACDSPSPPVSQRTNESVEGSEFAFLPYLEDLGSATEVTFRGVDLLLLSLAQRTTSRVELEMAFVQQIESALGMCPHCTIRLLPPALTAAELAVLNESIAGLNLKSSELRGWIAELLMRIQHRQRIVLEDETTNRNSRTLSTM